MKKIEETPVYGVIPPVNKQFNDFNLYDDDYSLPSVFLKKIKIWFGKPKEKCPKCLLGIKCWYINYITGEEKESDYHGCELKQTDIETNELEVKDKDYFTKIDIGYDFYITHFKISTKNQKFIEFGEIEKEYEKIISMNMEDNMILFFTGYFNSKGLRAIKIKYISRLYFVFYRILDILKLRYILKKNEKLKKSYLNEINYNKLDDSMKCFLHTCIFPDAVFASILKFL